MKEKVLTFFGVVAPIFFEHVVYTVNLRRYISRKGVTIAEPQNPPEAGRYKSVDYF